MCKEIWKDIPHMEYYKVSNKGRVKSFLTDRVNGKLLSQRDDKDGYKMVWTKYKSAARVHRLVLETFEPNYDSSMVCNHKDGLKHNNSLSNLEWVTIKQNTQHGYDNGLSYSAMSTPIEVIHNGKTLSVFSSIMKLSEHCGINRNALSIHIENNTTIFDEITIRKLDIDVLSVQSHPLLNKPFIPKKLTRYQVSPFMYKGEVFESLNEISQYLSLNPNRIQYLSNTRKEYNGGLIERITRYKYLRLKFND